MSKEAKIVQLKTVFQQFEDLAFTEFFENPGDYAEWEGLNISELQESVEFIIKTLNEAIDNDVFKLLSFAGINAFVNALTNSKKQFIPLLAQKAQPQFQAAAQQVDSVIQQLRIYNINYYLLAGNDVDEIRSIFEQETQNLVIQNAEVDSLKSSVEALIEPAVSGSLSKSFSDRRLSLFWGRVIWGIASVAFAAIAIYSTFNVSEAVIDSIKNSASSVQVATLESAPDTGDAYNESGQSVSLILLRSLVLIPIYLGFGFAFSQYKKERDLEEEYAHKAAVATTLPNYGDLAKDDGVKDQILSGASNVIFTSPIHRVTKKEKNTDMVGSIESLFKTAGKTFTKGD